MRPSSYNILVNVDKENDRYAIINGYAYTFDIVNKDVYQYLKTPDQAPALSDRTVEKLVRRGYLTSLTEDEEKELVRRITDKQHENARLKRFNFHFIMSYDCNLRCIYCYENNVLNGCSGPSKQKITREQIDKAFETIEEKANNSQSSGRICLYGGEPFLAENRDVLTYIVERGMAIKHGFSVISNGYDLDHYFDFLEDKVNLFSFQITLDGVEDIHNQNRPHCRKQDSFEKITANVDRLLKMGIRISIRINTAADGLERMDELMKLFEDKGWNQMKNFNAYWALLREEVDSMKKVTLKQIDLVRAFAEKKEKGEIIQRVDCQDYGVYYTVKQLLEGKPIPYKGHFCGAQSGNIIFDPLGDMYSCWDMVGQPEHKIGTYIPEFQISEHGFSQWFDKKVSDYKCAKCKYVLFCGGGCYIRDMKNTHEPAPGNCSQFPILFNHSLKQLYADSIQPNF